MAQDRYANIATLYGIQSGVNTLTFQELQTQLGFATGARDRALAMVIDQIDYMPDIGGLVQLIDETDYLALAITLSNQVTDLLNASDRRVLHNTLSLNLADGVAASAQMIRIPWSYQFSPPLIHAERTMYLGIQSGGLTAVAESRARIYYRTVEITSDELIELIETFRLVG